MDNQELYHLIKDGLFPIALERLRDSNTDRLLFDQLTKAHRISCSTVGGNYISLFCYVDVGLSNALHIHRYPDDVKLRITTSGSDGFTDSEHQLDLRTQWDVPLIDLMVALMQRVLISKGAKFGERPIAWA
jgi:hypothetical protein